MVTSPANAGIANPSASAKASVERSVFMAITPTHGCSGGKRKRVHEGGWFRNFVRFPPSLIGAQSVIIKKAPRQLSRLCCAQTHARADFWSRDWESRPNTEAHQEKREIAWEVFSIVTVASPPSGWRLPEAREVGNRPPASFFYPGAKEATCPASPLSSQRCAALRASSATFAMSASARVSRA